MHLLFLILLTVLIKLQHYGKLGACIVYCSSLMLVLIIVLCLVVLKAYMSKPFVFYCTVAVMFGN